MKYGTETVHGPHDDEPACNPADISPQPIVGESGIDTLRASILVIKPLTPEQLVAQGWNWRRLVLSTGEVHHRLYINIKKDEFQVAAPRLTYHLPSGRLVAEASLPRLLFGDNVALVTAQELPAALETMLERIQEHVGTCLSPLAEWNATRVDYACQWAVGEELVPLYLQLMTAASLSKHKRAVYGDCEGISWVSGSNSAKVYDKFREGKLEGARGLLRFEVTYRRTEYLAKRILGCDRRVQSLTSHSSIVTTLRYFWDRLKLGQHAFLAEEDLIRQLRREFGRPWATGWAVQRCHQQYGNDTYLRGLLPKSTYYYWLRRLRKAGLLHSSPIEVVLPGLCIC